MDRLAEQHGGTAPWPGFGSTSPGSRGPSAARRGRVATHDELLATLDEVVPASRAATSRSCSRSPWPATRASRREPRGQGEAMKAALMREYHRPLELVERPVPEPARPDRRARPRRRRRGLRDRPARDRGADGAGRRDAAARPRPRERGLGRGGRRRRHDRRQGRRGARLPAVQLRPLRRRAAAATTCTACATSSPACRSTAASPTTCSSRSARSSRLPAGVEPVAVAPHADAGLTAYHAVRRLAHLAGPGTTAVVIGVGGVGHIALQLLRELGSSAT